MIQYVASCDIVEYEYKGKKKTIDPARNFLRKFDLNVLKWSIEFMFAREINSPDEKNYKRFQNIKNMYRMIELSTIE